MTRSLKSRTARAGIVAFALTLPLLQPAVAPAQVQLAEETAPIGTRYILNASNGRTVTDKDFHGRHQLVFFGYTHCPDVCPTSLLTIGEVMDQLGPLADKVQPLFISVDPARDTPAVLAKYVTSFHPRLIGLTGTPEMIERVTKGYRVVADKVVPPGAPAGSYSVDHTVSVFHMGPDGRFIRRYAHAMPAGDIAAAVREIVGK